MQIIKHICESFSVYISKNIALQIISVQIGVDVKYKSACMYSITVHCKSYQYTSVVLPEIFFSVQSPEATDENSNSEMVKKQIAPDQQLSIRGDLVFV